MIDDYSGLQKAAILLITLGPEKASAIFQHLKEDEIESLTLEIANTRSVSPQDKESVLDEYYQVCLAQQYIAEGGIGYAKELLEKALGSEKAQGVISKLTASLQVRPFEFVRKTEPAQLLNFIQDEHPQTIAMIQRRQFFRLPCTIDMDFYEVRYDDKAESELEFCKKMYKNHAINIKNMNTVKSVILDISGGGIRFSLSTPLEEGTYFMAQFSLALEECTQQFNIVCKVINCTQSLDYADRYFARSKFIFDRMTEREKIVRFVFEEERRIRRREME